MEELETPSASEETAAERPAANAANAATIVAQAEGVTGAIVDQVQQLGAVTDAVTAELSFDAGLKALIEAVVYITDEPLTAEQIARGLDAPIEKVEQGLALLVDEYAKVDRGLSIREIAGGYK